MSVWIAACFDKNLTDKQADKLQPWLDEFGACSEAEIDDGGITLGWVDDRQWIYFEEKLLTKLPKGTSVRLWYDFDNAENGINRMPDKYLGPNAKAMKLEDIDEEIRKLNAMKEELTS